MLININASAINTTSTAADVQTVTKIQDLSDVDIPIALDNGQLLIWNGSSMNWENSNTVENDLTVTGNMIPYTLRANPDTNNAFTLYTTWENYSTDIYDTTTRLLTFKDYASDQVNVHQWLTQEGNPWYRFQASGSTDDGSHSTRLALQGDGGGEIRTISGSLTLTSDSVVVSNEIVPNILRANADTGNNFTFTTTWENYGTDIYDLTTKLVTYKDPGSDILALHRWLTENGNGWYTYSAIDTGGGDDGSHKTILNLGGSEAEITTNGGAFLIYNNSGQMTIASGDASMALTDNANFNALNNFQVEQSENIFLNANSQFEVNVGATANFNIGNNFEVYSGGSQLYMENGYGSNIRMSQQLEMVLREASDSQSTGVVIMRHNSDGGSTLNNGSQVQYIFEFKSEDETVDNIVGAMNATYNDAGNGNRFGFNLNDVATQNEVNSVFMHETYTATVQPFQFPSFNQTEINAMSPSAGWVLFNTTDTKLQVYDGSSWVDLH